MPSALPQLNMRVQAETLKRLAFVRSALAAERGAPVSQPEAVAWAILEAEKKLRKKLDKS
jgi:hypothetical protein